MLELRAVLDGETDWVGEVDSMDVAEGVREIDPVRPCIEETEIEAVGVIDELEERELLNELEGE